MPVAFPDISRRSLRRDRVFGSPLFVRTTRQQPSCAPPMRFPGTSTQSHSKISMKSQDHRGSGGRRGRGSRRPNRSKSEARAPQAPVRKSLWQKIVSFFKPETKSGGRSPAKARPETGASTAGGARKPEFVEVTSAKLYVGNLSYEAGESDLFDLFKGVGAVRNAEIVAHKHNDRSKGFGFVTMATVDEARRAVTELHDKEFMGRKLVVSGAKSSDREPNYRG